MQRCGSSPTDRRRRRQNTRAGITDKRGRGRVRHSGGRRGEERGDGRGDPSELQEESVCVDNCNKKGTGSNRKAVSNSSSNKGEGSGVAFACQWYAPANTCGMGWLHILPVGPDPHFLQVLLIKTPSTTTCSNACSRAWQVGASGVLYTPQ